MSETSSPEIEATLTFAPEKFLSNRAPRPSFQLYCPSTLVTHQVVARAEVMKEQKKKARRELFRQLFIQRERAGLAPDPDLIECDVLPEHFLACQRQKQFSYSTPVVH